MDTELVKQKFKIKLRTKLVLASITILIIIIASLAIDFKFQLMQYDEIGKNFTSILWTNAYASIISMIASFSIIFICIFISNLFIIKKLKCFFIEEGMQPARLPNYSVAFIIAIIGAFVTKDFLYQNALVFLKANMFYINDPIFGRDYGYYLFQRPFILALGDYISGTWLIVIIYTIAYYVLSFGVNFNAVAIESVKKYGVFTHNLINIAIFFIINAFTYRTESEKILYSNNGSFFGAGYTDVNVWLNVYRLAPFFLVAIVVTSLIFLLRSKVKKAVITVLAFPAFWILGAVIAILVQLIVVAPSEITKEKYYIRKHIDMTRYAYNFSDKLNESEIYVSDSLTPKMLKDNTNIVENLKMNDYSAVLEAENQLQSIRSYYKFVDADVTTYYVDGKPTVVFTAARELDKKRLDEKIYVNMKSRYTHGFGMVMSPVNIVNKEGQPEFTIKNMPPQSNNGLPDIAVPQIYFGELTKDHVIVNVKNINEIDYPEGESNKETIYSGEAGIQLTTLNRILLAIKLGDPKMLISQYIDSNSKVLINRDIIARVKLITPFLDVDKDPYIIVNNKGRLNWIIDAYTESPYFPCAQPTTLERQRKINYIRNSVKIIVDAYDGSMKFYIVDRQDPIIKTYESIYPDLFEDGPIPDDIAKHLKYPERIFKIQAEILKRYHTTDEATFFNNEDPWSIATHQGKGKQVDMEPNYTMLRLQGTKNPELTLMLPFTPENKSNMVGWMAARADISNYGKLILYKFPKNNVVSGPMQIESNIDQDPEITKVFASWDKSGTTVVRGDMLVVPVDDQNDSTVFYVEPVYITANNGLSIPQMKKVIVSYQGKIVMEDTLEKALQKIISVIPDKEDNSEQIIDKKELIERLLKAFEEVKAYSASNDWENYGKKMREFDSYMNKLNLRKEEFK